MLVVLAIGLAVLFSVTGTAKLAGVRQSLQVRDNLGMAPRLWQAIGLLELAGAAGAAVGLAWHPLGVAAATGLALLMVGAAVTRTRVRDPWVTIAGDVVILALAATLVTLYL